MSQREFNSFTDFLFLGIQATNVGISDIWLILHQLSRFMNHKLWSVEYSEDFNAPKISLHRKFRFIEKLEKSNILIPRKIQSTENTDSPKISIWSFEQFNGSSMNQTGPEWTNQIQVEGRQPTNEKTCEDKQQQMASVFRDLQLTKFSRRNFDH